MRLTTRTFDTYSVSENDTFNVQQKLGKLEDIEEELGIDLAILFKALKDGIYTNKWLHKTKYGFDLERKRFEGNCSGDYGVVETSFFYFKDYGKTWALTKKELQDNDKNELNNLFPEEYKDGVELDTDSGLGTYLK